MAKGGRELNRNPRLRRSKSNKWRHLRCRRRWQACQLSEDNTYLRNCMLPSPFFSCRRNQNPPFFFPTARWLLNGGPCPERVPGGLPVPGSRHMLCTPGRVEWRSTVVRHLIHYHRKGYGEQATDRNGERIWTVVSLHLYQKCLYCLFYCANAYTKSHAHSAGLKQACPNGVFVSLTPGDPSLWSGVIFVRKGKYILVPYICLLYSHQYEAMASYP